MRKFAGKCLALLLALLMPLTSMPVSLAESYTSEPFNVNVETPSREEVIAKAVADNVSSGAYVSCIAPWRNPPRCPLARSLPIASAMR